MVRRMLRLMPISGLDEAMSDKASEMMGNSSK